MGLASQIWATERAVALTFDDGPFPDATVALIHILAAHHVPATFLVTGRACERYPELVRMIDNAGHELGNHTYSHMRLTGLTDDQIKLELQSTTQIINQFTGKSVKWYRPPGGKLDSRVITIATELGLRLATWDINAQDAEAPDKRLSPTELEAYQNRLLSKIAPGRIILMHNGSVGTLQVLPGLITALKSKGYHCVTLAKLVQNNHHINHR